MGAGALREAVLATIQPWASLQAARSPRPQPPGILAAARSAGALAVLLLCALVWPLAAGAQDETADDGESQGTGIAYQPRIEGDLDDSLKSLLEQSSQLFALQDEPPESLAGLRRRAEGDLTRLTDALRSEGYYDSRLEQQIDDKTTPLEVTITVTTGPVYSLSDYKVIYQGDAPDPNPAARLRDLGLRIGRPAVAQNIIDAQRALVRSLRNSGYPLADVDDRRTVVDHETRGMSVELAATAGPRADFGPVAIEGLTDVDEDYVRKLLPWQQGELYDEAKLEEARLALSETALFSSIRFEKAEEVDAEGQLPITLKLAEGPPRSIGFGLSYSTSEGPGGQAFWEHRNLFGSNERLRLSLKAALIDRSLNADFRKPHFLRLDQSLLVQGTIAQRDTDAFEEESARAFLGLERKLSEIWSVTGGGAIEYAIIKDETEDNPNEDATDRYLLYSLPLSATRDTSDNLLNPTKGTRATLWVTPYTGTRDLDEPTAFLVNELTGAGYLSLDRRNRIILAARTRIGSIVGQATDELPANKRFYSGGGGSVRGYAFQSIGPEDDKGDPTGGRSVLEVSGEVRLRVTEDIGIVPFIDGGTVSEQPYVDFDEEFLWAGGLGLRYFTGIGPLRLDVAFPINGRDSDDFFQFYISLGQAF